MADATNPYQPPSFIDQTADTGNEETIELNGHVSFDDLVALIGTQLIIRILQIASVIGALSAGVLPIVFGVANLNKTTEALGMLGLGVVTLATLTLVNWWCSGKQRGRRLTKTHPGIIGPLNGRLDEFGLTYRSDSGERDYQISWATFSDVAVTPKGIRLGWSKGVPTTIAIPAMCIINCPADAIASKVRRYRKNATEPAIAEVVPDWDEAPTHAIRYQSFVPVKPPLSPREDRRVKIYNRIVTASWANSVGLWWFYGIEVAIAFMAGTQGLAYWFFRHEIHRSQPDAYVFRMWGWITSDAIHGYLPGQTWQRSLHDATRREFVNGTVQVEFPDGSGIAFSPENLHPADAERWPELIEIVNSTRNDTMRNTPSSP